MLNKLNYHNNQHCNTCFAPQQGYQATKVPSQDACYVRELEQTLEEQVDILQESLSYNVTASGNATGIPSEGDSDFGEAILAFCDIFPIYELIFDDDSDDDDSSDEDQSENESRMSLRSSEEGSSSEDTSEEGSSEETGTPSPGLRQISVTFTKCLLLCFIPVCYTTTLTIPTGITIIFPWAFFG